MDVHGSDVLRPTGGQPRPADDRARPVAELYRRIGISFRARSTGRVRFTAEDAGWSVGPAEGPEARGPGEAVLLTLAGRPEGVADLVGPGVEHLRR